MTSPRSRRRRSSGSRAAGLIALLATLAAAPRSFAQSSPLVRTAGGVTIDWGQGTLTAQGGAAADLHMPSADLARPGAVRRARAAALTKLRDALAALPLGADRTFPAATIDSALARAQTTHVEYQSNGGAVVKVTVRFADWVAPPSGETAPDAGAPDAGAAGVLPVATLVIPTAALSAAPAVKGGGREAQLGAAVYRLGTPPAEAHAISGKTDRQGRLLLETDAKTVQKLAGAVVVIYVQKVTR